MLVMTFTLSPQNCVIGVLPNSFRMELRHDQDIQLEGHMVDSGQDSSPLCLIMFLIFEMREWNMKGLTSPKIYGPRCEILCAFTFSVRMSPQVQTEGEQKETHGSV